MEIIIGLVIGAFLGLIPASIAKKKGHSFGLWWFYGWMLFIVAIIHVQFIEDRSVPSSVNPQPQYTPVQPYTPSQTYTPPQNPPRAQVDSTEALKKYKELLDGGVITQEEFDAKKKQLLGL